MTKHKSHKGKQLLPTTLEQAWRDLAAACFLLAIEDARQARDLVKRDKAKNWLRSKGAESFFDAFTNFNDKERINWIEKNCPKLGQ